MDDYGAPAASVKLSSRCRICGAPQLGEALICRLFDEEEEPLHILTKKIKELFDIMVNSSDPSKIICKDCVSSINQYYTFRQQVKSSQILYFNIKKDIDSQINSPQDTSQPNFYKDSSEKVLIKKEISDAFPDTSMELSLDCEDELLVKNEIDRNNSDDEPKIDESEFNPNEIIKGHKFIINNEKLAKLASEFYNIECDLCSASPELTSINQLMEHYSTEHSTPGYVICCETKLTDRRNINWHMAQHLQPSAFECKECKKTFRTPNILHKHYQIHMAKAEENFQCENCDKRHMPFEVPNLIRCQHISNKMYCKCLNMRDVHMFCADFYSLNSRIAEDAFILNHIKILKIKRRRTNNPNSKKTISIQYFFTFSDEDDARELQVCQKIFSKVLNVSRDRITRIANKYNKTGILVSDMRGGDRKEGFYREKRSAVKKFLEGFVFTKSHKCKNHVVKQQCIPSDCTVSSLSNIYNEKATEGLRVKFSYFRNILKKEFNVEFNTKCRECSKTIE